MNPRPALLALTCLMVSGCIAHPAGRDPETETDPGADSASVPTPNRAQANTPDDEASRPETAPDADPRADPGANPAIGPETADPDETADATGETGPPLPAFDCDASPWVVHRPESAARIGDALFIGLEDGRVVQAALGDRHVSWPYDAPVLAGIEMDQGLADIRPVRPGLFVRLVRRGNVGRVEFLGAPVEAAPLGRPEGGVAAGLVPFSVSVYTDAAGPFAIADGLVFLCAAGSLVALDSADPRAPVETRLGSTACQSSDGLVAGSASLGRFTHGHGQLVPQFAVHTLGATGATERVDMGFNPGGAHQYGDIVGLFLGTRRGLVDVRNTHNFFVLDLVGDTGSRIADGRIDVTADTHLVSLQSDLAWFASSEQITAYDLSVPSAPVARAIRWPAFTVRALATARAETPRVLFADTELVVFRGADGLSSVWSMGDGSHWAQTMEACSDRPGHGD